MGETNHAFIIPPTANIAGIPNDKDLLRSFQVYKPSHETQLLESEKNRSILPEVFFENDLKLLSELCVRALAKSFGPIELPPIVDNARNFRIFYDNVGIDLPLERICDISDNKYWERAVLSIGRNIIYALLKDFDWKSKAISDKLINIIESGVVEKWADDEMNTLAAKIKPIVTDITIKHLQPMQEESYERNFIPKDPEVTSEEEEDEEEDIKWKELVENYVESIQESSSENNADANSDTRSLVSYALSEDLDVSLVNKFLLTDEDVEIDRIETEIKESRINERINLIEKRKREKEEQIKRREEREIRRIEREEREAIEAILAAKELRRQLRLAREADPPPRKKKPPLGPDGKPIKSKKKKKKKKVVIVEEEPKIIIPYEEILARRQLYNFPAKDCHHIDLRFLNLFENLETLAIAFEGPLSNTFHQRFLNFSYKDIRNLAAGISPLKNLKTFKLRNSRMDALKFDIIVTALQNVESLEYLDFGYDFIDDESALTMYKYFKNAKAINTLELEGNKFNNDFLIKLAYGLYQYKLNDIIYLGLGHNILKHEGMQALVEVLIKTDHVMKLNLTGALLDPEIMSSGIAKLIRQHPFICEINLMAIPIDWQKSVDLVTALYTNTRILILDVRGCGLDTEIEYEIELLLRRNIFLRDNPYINDTDITEQELYEYLKTKRNKLLTGAKKSIEKRIECFKNCPNEKDELSVEAIINQLEYERRSLSSNGSQIIPLEDEVPFKFEPNIFNEEDFFKHLYLPGPEERFYYIQALKREKHELNMLEL